jgi:hypothetical protein
MVLVDPVMRLPKMRDLVPRSLKPSRYLARLAMKRTNCTVIAGPFAGMKYIGSSIASAHVPKLLGTYEREIAGAVEEICRRKPAVVIDIGAAEGYYAVGFAMRLPDSKIIAFESEGLGRRELGRLAALNDVGGRIEIRGFCSQVDLMRLACEFDSATYVIDIEGHERMLVDEDIQSALSRSTILVEIHEFLEPGIAAALESQYRATHDISCILQQPRDPDEYPWDTIVTRLLPVQYIEWAVSEWRPIRMQWLWMKPILGERRSGQ